MSLLLALALLGAPDGFLAAQYAPRDLALRGCAECRGEPDDVCEVHAGVQLQPLDQYARQRWPAPGRIKLLRSKAESDCAVKGLFSSRGSIELAAVRIAASPPSAALAEIAGPGVRGWPRMPQRRKFEAHLAARPQRAAVRMALACWPSDKGWPAASGSDARRPDQHNVCEWWLLSVKPESGEPDPGGVSFPLGPAPFGYGDVRWARAFDSSSSFDDSILLGEAAPPQPPVPPAPLPPAPAPMHAACGETARSRTATLDRFDQWDARIRASARPSLDRGAFALDAAAWSGHCQELEVLRGALEQQLGCAVELQGRCGALGEAR